MLAVEANVGSLVPVDLMKGDQMKPEFLEMNPFHHVPVMEDGKVRIGEGSAILRYLAMKYKQEAYPGSKDAAKSAMIDFAVTAAASEVYPKFTPVVYPVMGFASPPADQAAANEEFSKVVNTWLEHFVKGTDFVKGSTPTIADYAMASMLFASSQPVVVEKTGFKPSERHTQFVETFCKTVKSSTVLTDGETSLKAFIASKA
jgi:glutathione S-transferase